MNWSIQMSALVSLPENCGTNPGWSECSWSTETDGHGLLSISFLMDPCFSPFVIHWLLIDVPNMHSKQRGTSSLKSRNLYGRTPTFAILIRDMDWRWDNLSCQDLNSCCKGDSNSVNMIFSICSYVILFYSFNLYLHN